MKEGQGLPTWPLPFPGSGSTERGKKKESRRERKGKGQVWHCPVRSLGRAVNGGRGRKEKDARKGKKGGGRTPALPAAPSTLC